MVAYLIGYDDANACGSDSDLCRTGCVFRRKLVGRADAIEWLGSRMDPYVLTERRGSRLGATDVRQNERTRRVQHGRRRR